MRISAGYWIRFSTLVQPAHPRSARGAELAPAGWALSAKEP
ncbi:MAG: hypothetical protein V9G19_19230 [Tetrasphaera sp.]